MYVQDYRPFSYDMVIGQKSVVNDLKKRSLKGEFPSVSIYTGPTGSGKTTCAFITAALINDPDPIQKDSCYAPNPESKSSRAILSEKFSRDVAFYDASTMGKDDVMALESVVASSPMFDKNKVVIIDEAQELTKASKGVTLRLLEKKRDNVYIILCTMEPEKFGKAVIDRGQQFKFKAIDSMVIAEHLFEVTKKELGEENIPDEFIEKGLFSIADAAEGSVRSALQSLERCINAELFTQEEIEAELGVMGNERVGDILSDLINDLSPASFLSLKGDSLKEFYYKSFRILLDTLYYNQFGSLTPKWKEKLAFKLSQEPSRVQYLVEAWNKISERPYWYEAAVEAEVLLFINRQTRSKKLQESKTVKREPIREEL